MSSLRSRTWLLVVVSLLSLLLVSAAFADKVHLKDGSVVEGTVVRETEGFVQVRVKTGGIEAVRTISRADIKSIEKDAAIVTPADGVKPAEAVKPTSGKPDNRAERAAQAAERLDKGASRIAILNFGAPASWNSEIGDTVGSQIRAGSWQAVIPLLEKDKVDTVVVRISSGGGSDEFYKFQDLFHNVYKKKFRTVGWVESAISAAAMAAYTIEEFYFMPNGAFGACVGWRGNLQNMEGAELELVLLRMEEASLKGGRSPAIMRAMQLEVPLTASIDKNTGQVTWFQDTSGEHMINRPGQVLTLTANDAVRFGFARAIVATKEELPAAMGIREYSWGGEEAARKIDEDMRAADRSEKQWELKLRELELNAGIAEQTPDRADRGKFVGRAINALKELRSLARANPGMPAMYGFGPGWFDETEEQLRKLLRD
jgi:hypothetical protein